MVEPFKGLLFLVRRHHGAIFALIAASFYTGNSLLVKVLTKETDPIQLVAEMSVGMTLGPAFVLAVSGATPPEKLQHYIWLSLSGLSACAYLVLFSFAVIYTDVGDALTVTYSSLVIAGIISCIMLKEIPGLFEVLFSILAFIGVTFVARPQFIFSILDDSVQTEGSEMLGIALAFGSAIAISFTLNIMRKQLDFGFHSCLPLLAHGVVTFVTSSILTLLLHRWRAQSLLDCSLAIGAGFCYFSAQMMVYLALDNESITLVNVVLSTDIVMVFVLQFVLLGVHSPWTSYVGATLIISASIGITLNKKESSDFCEM